MLRLDEVRYLYPEYGDMTDYELSSAIHNAYYPNVPYEQFARQFRGPLEEDRNAVAARDYNAAHPDDPVKAEDFGQTGYLDDARTGVMAGLNDLASDALWAASRGTQAVGLQGIGGLLGSASDFFHRNAEERRREYSPAGSRAGTDAGTGTGTGTESGTGTGTGSGTGPAS